MENIKCPECSGMLKIEKRDVELFEKSIGKFACEVCAKCGAVFLPEEEMKKVEEESKKLGIFGMEALTKVGVSGNSVMVRIHKTMADFLGLTKGAIVRCFPIDRRKLIVERVG